MRLAAFACWLLVVLVSAAPASAQDQQDNLARAAAYWGTGPDCPDGVHVTVDEAFVGPDTFARGGGCGIWVGDRFAAESAGGQCQTIVHEWGHLLGYGEDHAWHEGLPADPVGVMASFAMPPSCAALDAPAAPAPAASTTPTPAPAVTAPSVTAPARVGWKTRRALAIAQAVWHPTCGTLRIAYGDPIQNGANPNASGWAWKNDCTIGINAHRRVSFEELCTTVLHEAGHVTGLGHSTNRRSVMYAEPLLMKTIAVIGSHTVTTWVGADRRCLNHGRSFLRRHRLLA